MKKPEPELDPVARFDQAIVKASREARRRLRAIKVANAIAANAAREYESVKLEGKGHFGVVRKRRQ